MSSPNKKLSQIQPTPPVGKGTASDANLQNQPAFVLGNVDLQSRGQRLSSGDDRSFSPGFSLGLDSGSKQESSISSSINKMLPNTNFSSQRRIVSLVCATVIFMAVYFYKIIQRNSYQNE